jgi:hypothetical protein
MDYTKYMDEYNKIGYSKDGIFIVNDLVNKDDIPILSNFINQKNAQGPIERWKIEDAEINKLLNKYEQISFNEIKKHYTDKFNVTVKPFPVVPAHLVNWLPGGGMSPHSDSETRLREPAIPGGFYRYNITTIFYLTDQYVGGEIFFPDFEEYQPQIKAGTLVMFPSRYTHAIKPHISGTRHTLPMFFTFDIEDGYIDDQSYHEGDISKILF